MTRRITDLPEPPDRVPYRIPLRNLLQDVIYAHAHPDSLEYNDCDVDPCMWCVSAKSHLDEMEEKR